jgi:hypothetical protein
MDPVWPSRRAGRAAIAQQVCTGIGRDESADLLREAALAARRAYPGPDPPHSNAVSSGEKGIKGTGRTQNASGLRSTPEASISAL